MQDVIRRTFAASINAKERFVVEHGETLERVARLMAEALQQGHKILLFGNGGSAADAQHIAAEFVNRFMIERRPLPALALTTDTSAITSIGNDYGFDQIFSKQIEALGAAGDVAIAISTSGNSPNVLRAIEACGKVGCFVVGLTGGDGGKMKDQVGPFGRERCGDTRRGEVGRKRFDRAAEARGRRWRHHVGQRQPVDRLAADRAGLDQRCEQLPPDHAGRPDNQNMHVLSSASTCPAAP